MPEMVEGEVRSRVGRGGTAAFPANQQQQNLLGLEIRLMCPICKFIGAFFPDLPAVSVEMDQLLQSQCKKGRVDPLVGH